MLATYSVSLGSGPKVIVGGEKRREARSQGSSAMEYMKAKNVCSTDYVCRHDSFIVRVYIWKPDIERDPSFAM
jgi:hypothetical protein